MTHTLTRRPDKKDLFTSKQERDEREPNVSPQLLKAVEEAFKRDPTPEDIFYYIYAVLYSNIYRTKYGEFLKGDFLRIPFAKDYKLFCKMGKGGRALVELHLLRSNGLDRPIAKFQGKGDHKVERVKYEQGKVHINDDQHFEGISPEMWQYQIGGYQVCDKWLKDRQGRFLSLDDIKHYCRLVTAIGKTIEIQKEIDKVYPEVEREAMEFIGSEKT